VRPTDRGSEGTRTDAQKVMQFLPSGRTADPGQVGGTDMLVPQFQDVFSSLPTETGEGGGWWVAGQLSFGEALPELLRYSEILMDKVFIAITLLSGAGTAVHYAHGSY